MIRIVSLVPGATEMVVALGAIESLVGISHECDYPPGITHLPHLTSTPIDPDASGGEIDASVRAVGAAGGPVVAVDAGALAALQPDVILTQALCDVCAVSEVPGHPRVISLTGRTLEGVLEDIDRLAGAIGRAAEGRAVIARLRARAEALRSRARGSAVPRRVVCLEWLDPPFLAGHWVPDLVTLAGAVDVGATSGAHSIQVDWSTVNALPADAVIVMLCGMGLERARAELERDALASGQLRARCVPVWIVDGNAYTSRPGPRLLDGAECIAAALAGEEREGVIRWR